ncbi:unnamed protein product, partial [Choristocarpus tenellus]
MDKSIALCLLESGTMVKMTKTCATCEVKTVQHVVPLVTPCAPVVFLVIAQDLIALDAASLDISGLFERNGLSPFLRGALFSRSLSIDASFAEEVSNSSPLFMLPVAAVQRGRDHGVPSYNDAREAYNLTRVTSFDQITSDTAMQELLRASYEQNPDEVDAFTGALAEDPVSNRLGALLQAWEGKGGQIGLLRSYLGDCFYHDHDIAFEDVENTTLSELIKRNTDI